MKSMISYPCGRSLSFLNDRIGTPVAYSFWFSKSWDPRWNTALTLKVKNRLIMSPAYFHFVRGLRYYWMHPIQRWLYQYSVVIREYLCNNKADIIRFVLEDNDDNSESSPGSIRGN